MRMTKKTEAREKLIDIVLGMAIFLVSVSILGIGYVLSADSTTISTEVNITSALPTVESIVVNSGSSINLTEGNTTKVLCNASIVSYGGLGDLNLVNATLFRTNMSQYYGTHDNNSWMHLSNCTYDSTPEAFVYAFNCTFNMTYHAFNGTWNCTVWANNSLGWGNKSNSTWVDTLYFMNITDAIDFGDMAVFDTSEVASINVTNWGNMPLNYTIYAYGGEDNATGYNLSFMCPDGPGTNISIDSLRWYTDDRAWSNMINSTIGPLLVDNITVQKQTTDTNIWNTTYWKLYVPPNPFGACNGTIVIESTAY